jgi:hypothetical protein
VVAEDSEAVEEEAVVEDFVDGEAEVSVEVVVEVVEEAEAEVEVDTVERDTNFQNNLLQKID